MDGTDRWMDGHNANGWADGRGMDSPLSGELLQGPCRLGRAVRMPHAAGLNDVSLGRVRRPRIGGGPLDDGRDAWRDDADGDTAEPSATDHDGPGPAGAVFPPRPAVDEAGGTVGTGVAADEDKGVEGRDGVGAGGDGAEEATRRVGRGGRGRGRRQRTGREGAKGRCLPPRRSRVPSPKLASSHVPPRHRRCPLHESLQRERGTDMDGQMDGWMDGNIEAPHARAPTRTNAHTQTYVDARLNRSPSPPPDRRLPRRC